MCSIKSFLQNSVVIPRPAGRQPSYSWLELLVMFLTPGAHGQEIELTTHTSFWVANNPPTMCWSCPVRESLLWCMSHRCILCMESRRLLNSNASVILGIRCYRLIELINANVAMDHGCKRVPCKHFHAIHILFCFPQLKLSSLPYVTSNLYENSIHETNFSNRSFLGREFDGQPGALHWVWSNE